MQKTNVEEYIDNETRNIYNEKIENKSIKK